MAYEANSRTQVLARAFAVPDALRAAWRTALVTRVAVLAVAFFAALSLGGPGSEGLGERNAAKFDVPALTHPLGGFGDLTLSPLARWDAVWFLSVADSGYQGAAPQRAAFFPLYPLAVRTVGELGGGSRGALLVAAYLVSLAAFVAALYLLHRLVTLELGRPLAAPTLLLLAVFPASLYFGAPYSESLFLLVSVGAFYAARTGRWGWAGTCAAAATATRSAGVLLLVPLVILYLSQERAPRVRADALWLLLAPLGLGAFAAYLAMAHGDGLAFLDVQGAWYREFAGPLGGAWDGLVAAVDGARQLLSGSRETVYFDRAGGDPFRVASMNLMLFGFLAFGLIAAIGVLRRLPRAYGAYVVAALALPLSFPVGPQPLMSLPRFLSVLFPLFMWLALVCEERRITDRAAAASAVGLGWFVTQFATWHWIA
jgi:mannosyltransferase PIG-V